jgi:hypothetical protein
MKVKIIRGTVANKAAVLPGEVIDVSDQDGKYLIALGKAEAVEEVEKRSPRKKGPAKETATHEPSEKAVKE